MIHQDKLHNQTDLQSVFLLLQLQFVLFYFPVKPSGLCRKMQTTLQAQIKLEK